MSTNLDIRRILDLRANGQCEGTAVTKKGQPKCTKPINKADWLAACRLLNQMDRSEDIRHAVDDLEELAGLLLCNEWHNSLRRPQNSQVRKMYNKWEKFVNEEYLRLKNEEEREAEREEAERVRLAERKREAERERGAEGKREAERRAQRVADRRSIATRVMTKLEEERVRTARAAIPVSELSPASGMTSIDDPFVTEEATSSRPNIFSKFIPSNKVEDEEEEGEEAAFSSDFSPEEPTGLSIREGKEPESLPYMPSPPTHEPSSPIKNRRIAVAEQQETGRSTIRPGTSSMAKFEYEFGSNLAAKAPSFNFETPTKLNIAQREMLPSSGATNFTAFSDSSFGMSTSSTSTTPEKEGVGELEREMAKPMNLGLSSRSGTSTYEFGSGAEKQFEFKASITPRKPSLPSSSTSPSAVLFQFTPPKECQAEGSSTSTPPTQTRERLGLAISAQVDQPQPGNVGAQPITLSRNNEDSFGFANIIPSSTRYTTYLPARQRYGLITPPETPEMLTGASGKPINDSNYFRDERWREASSAMPRITRKPLPESPRSLEGGEPGQEQGRAACGGREDQGVGDCNCSKAYKDVSEVPTGCLERFGFRRLKEKVVAKAKAMRVRTLKVKETDSPDSG